MARGVEDLMSGPLVRYVRSQMTLVVGSRIDETAQACSECLSNSVSLRVVISGPLDKFPHQLKATVDTVPNQAAFRHIVCLDEEFRFLSSLALVSFHAKPNLKYSHLFLITDSYGKASFSFYSFTSIIELFWHNDVRNLPCS